MSSKGKGKEVARDPREERKHMVKQLKSAARKYAPVHPTFRRPSTKYTKRELRYLVEHGSLASAAPDHELVQQLIASIRNITGYTLSRRAMEDELVTLCDKIDECFFFGLLRGRLWPENQEKKLIRLSVQNQQHEGQRRGAYSPQDDIIRIYVDAEGHLGKYTATLAHEMVHAYLYIFPEDYSISNAPTHSDASPHGRDWAALTVFIQSTLAG